MSRPKRNHNRPRKGTRTTADAIYDPAAIERIKQNLLPTPRDYCFFVLGINTAYRAGELLSLTVAQVADLKPGDTLTVWQSKTKKERTVGVNRAACEAIQRWLAVHPRPEPDAPLFISRTGLSQALTVSTVSGMVKQWCQEVGLKGNFSSHTLRKTFGYHQVKRNPHLPNRQVVPTLMQAYGHATERQTLQYACIQLEDELRLYEFEL